MQATLTGKRKLGIGKCWGQEIGIGSSACTLTEPNSAAFRQRFCGHCLKHGVAVPASRVLVVLDPALSPANHHGSGVWNEPRPGATSWPAHSACHHRHAGQRHREPRSDGVMSHDIT